MSKNRDFSQEMGEKQPVFQWIQSSHYLCYIFSLQKITDLQAFIVTCELVDCLFFATLVQ